MQNDYLKCLDCLEEKSNIDFSKNKKTKTGFSLYCKKCKGVRDIKSREKHKVKRLEKARLRYENEKDKILEINRKSRAKNKEKNKETRKKNRELYPEKILRQKRESRIRNKSHINKHSKERYHSDPQYKLCVSLRNRMTKMIGRGSKVGSAVKDLGCSVKELKIYLESLFQPGMTWENHGEWEIDHIKPLSSFDLTNREEFLKACHWSNLQPLWAADNLRKSDKYDPK